MYIYLHRQLADMLKGWGGWCGLALLTLSGHSACSLSPLGHITSFHFITERWKKGGARKGRRVPTAAWRWLPCCIPPLAHEAKLPSSALQRHAAPGAHTQVSGASVPLI